MSKVQKMKSIVTPLRAEDVCLSVDQLNALLDDDANFSPEHDVGSERICFVRQNGFVVGIALVDRFNRNIGEHAIIKSLHQWFPSTVKESYTWEDVLLHALRDEHTDYIFSTRYASLCRFTSDSLKLINRWWDMTVKPILISKPETSKVETSKVESSKVESSKGESSKVESKKRLAPATASETEEPPSKKAATQATQEIPANEMHSQAAALVHYMRLPVGQRFKLGDAERVFLERMNAFKPTALTEYDLLHMGYAPQTDAIKQQLAFYTECMKLAGVQI
jgi:hypothetical protein